MATLSEFNISREYGTRPSINGISVGYIWEVEEGETYDMVSFSIKEIDRYFWHEVLCLKAGMSEEEIRSKVEYYVGLITEEDINEYKSFLKQGEKYGWD